MEAPYDGTVIQIHTLRHPSRFPIIQSLFVSCPPLFTETVILPGGREDVSKFSFGKAQPLSAYLVEIYRDQVAVIIFILIMDLH